ncbi:hypothetical protein [Sphingomonas sp. UYP23]
MRIDIRADLKPLQRAFIALGAKQVPFATSLALNALAKGVATQERAEVDKTFSTPASFTENAFRIAVATKSNPIATVAAKDKTNAHGGQAAYLAPYVIGGERFLGSKKGMLAPRSVGLNQYGNLTKGKLASLRGRPNVFIGKLQTKSGRIISGVWQGPAAVKALRRKSAGVSTTQGGAKLLIQFEDTTPVKKRFDFFGRATSYLKSNAAREFDAAMRQALATARR